MDDRYIDKVTTWDKSGSPVGFCPKTRALDPCQVNPLLMLSKSEPFM